MDIQGNVTVDLAEYGGEGQIVLAPLSLRRQNEFINALGSVKVDRNGQPQPMKLRLGDLTTAKVLVYVKTAPFSTKLEDFEPFFQYCDELDEKQAGASVRLWDRLTEAAEEIEARSSHPFVPSEQSPTMSMD